MADHSRSLDEIVRRGEEIFERVVAPQVASLDGHLFLLIDIESGDFEVDQREIAAATRLRARHPEGQFYFRRVGSPFARRFGYRVGAEKRERRLLAGGFGASATEDVES